MAVHDLGERLCRLQFSQNFFFPRDDSDIVHHFAQPEEGIAGELKAGLGGVQRRAACFKGGRRHTGGKLDIDVKRRRRKPRKRRHEVLRTRDAADVDQLVRVGDNAARAVRHSKARKRLGREHGALDVDMRIDQTGQEDHTRAVIRLTGDILAADADDDAVLDGDLPFLRLAREYIEDAGIADDEVTGFALHGAVDEIFHIFHYNMTRLIFQAAPHILFDFCTHSHGIEHRKQHDTRIAQHRDPERQQAAQRKRHERKLDRN